MTMTDPIADMLTRIRNANAVSHKTVDMPCSKLKLGLAEALKREGFISGFEISEDGKQNMLKVILKYGPDGENLINIIKRESKPGCRKYSGAGDIKPVLAGTGIAIYSTSKGVLSDRECRAQNTGGEYLCTVY
jgi:small subunit ribosomal protein S8